MGRLTTHVLDTALGRPAAGLKLELYALGSAPRLLRTVSTNKEGRIDEPLLAEGNLEPGEYELRFHAGDYLRKMGVKLSNPAFLDVIPVRFGVAEPSQHYHVPLLLSPYGYSTYRGS